MPAAAGPGVAPTLMLAVLLAVLLAFGLGGCATSSGRAGGPGTAAAVKPPRGGVARPAEASVAWRLTLQTRRSGWPPPELARYVEQTTGLPVRHLSAATPQWQIVELRCPGEPDCRRAVKLLRQDGAFGVIEVDRLPLPAARAAR